MKKRQIAPLLSLLEGCIGKVRDESHYIKALTHSSFNKSDNNQRMEFLGDSVLGLVISEYLYRSFSDKMEGDLTLMKSVLVSSKILTAVGKKLDLVKFLRVGGSLSQDRMPKSVFEDAVEALIAAIYLDKGFSAARSFIHEYVIRPFKDELSGENYLNYKTLLQEHYQKTHKLVPIYEVVREWGPDHKKNFEVVVKVNGQVFGPGRGDSKKDAEQKCAKIALKRLNLL
ncbi:MAG: ribonuclease III [Planctomycetes bacterium]|nr:ribonuclease III [Planctomycetota bacterium]